MGVIRLHDQWVAGTGRTVPTGSRRGIRRSREPPVPGSRPFALHDRARGWNHRRPDDDPRGGGCSQLRRAGYRRRRGQGEPSLAGGVAHALLRRDHLGADPADAGRHRVADPLHPADQRHRRPRRPHRRRRQRAGQLRRSSRRSHHPLPRRIDHVGGHAGRRRARHRLRAQQRPGRLRRPLLRPDPRLGRPGRGHHRPRQPAPRHPQQRPHHHPRADRSGGVRP